MGALFAKAPEPVGNKVNFNTLFKNVNLHVVNTKTGLCRSVAKELQELDPILQKHQVKLVGVGLGYHSLEDMLQNGVWKGMPLYIDMEKTFYDKLKLGRGNVQMLVTKKVSKANEKALKEGVGRTDDLTDGMLLGGTYVIEKGGDKVLMEFQQTYYGEHASNEDILRSLGISDEEISNFVKERASAKASSGEEETPM
eukprot:g372.t1